MSGRDDIKTITSSANLATDQNYTSVTGSDVTVSGIQKRALDTFLAGGTVSSVPSGLSIAGLITEVTLNTVTWTALPAASLVDRNSMALQNLNADIISVNFATPAGTKIGRASCRERV